MSPVAALNRSVEFTCLACTDTDDPDLLFMDRVAVLGEVADLRLMIETEFEDCLPDLVEIEDRATIVALASNAYCDKCGKEVTS